jgi:hypothetical protein
MVRRKAVVISECSSTATASGFPCRGTDRRGDRLHPPMLRHALNIADCSTCCNYLQGSHHPHFVRIKLDRCFPPHDCQLKNQLMVFVMRLLNGLAKYGVLIGKRPVEDA